MMVNTGESAVVIRMINSVKKDVRGDEGISLSCLRKVEVVTKCFWDGFVRWYHAIDRV